MMIDLVIWGKIAIGFVSAFATVWVASQQFFVTMPPSLFNKIAFAWSVFSRAGVYLVLYIGLGMATQSDVLGYYYPQALDGMQGKLVYRDFQSSYGPLFPYICAMATMLWNDPRCIVLFAIVLELASLPIWMNIARGAFGEKVSRMALLLYLLSPISWYNVVILGTNQVWMSFFLSLSFLAHHKKNAALSGIMAAVCLLAVKILALLFVPVLALGALQIRRWWGFACAFLFSVGIPLLFLILKGVNPLTPILYEGGATSSGNIPYLMGIFRITFDAPMGIAFMTVCLLVLATFFLWAVYKQLGSCRAGQMFLLTGILFIFMLLSKKSFPAYLEMTLFPVSLSIALMNAPGLTNKRNAPVFGTSNLMGRFMGTGVIPKDVVMFCLLGITAIIEPTFWFRVFHQKDLTFLPNVSLINGIMFLFIELSLVSCYGYFLLRIIKNMREYHVVQIEQIGASKS
jgi:hypothetical protein